MELKHTIEYIIKNYSFPSRTFSHENESFFNLAQFILYSQNMKVWHEHEELMHWAGGDKNWQSMVE